MRGAFQIVSGYLPDEFGDVDTGRAALRTGSVITEETTVRIDQCRIPGFEWGMDIAEVLRIFLVGEPMMNDSHKNRFSQLRQFPIGLRPPVAEELPDIPHF